MALVAAMVALAGCATTPPPKVRMIPTADHGVGVRFSRGNALMVSNGPSSAIMLLPVRYNDTQKFFFSIAAFNTSSYPINIGSEDVRLYLDGQLYRVQDFDYLRHTARMSARRETNLAWADAAVDYFLTLQEIEDHPRRHDIAYRSASRQLQASHDHIQRRLRRPSPLWAGPCWRRRPSTPARPTAAPSWRDRRKYTAAWRHCWLWVRPETQKTPRLEAMGFPQIRASRPDVMREQDLGDTSHLTSSPEILADRL
ncbi:hypothetical protein BJP32_11340 [Brevundimonas sp. ZS04]|nr:hypothetical protein BJP32_11340 [Brevundimonas sp. ZS04]